METKKTRIRGNKRAKYVFRLPDDDIATQMAIGKGDLDIIEVYKAILGVSRRAVLHEMIGTAARCWEENHPKVINKMAETIAGQKSLLFLYRAKFGRLTEDQGKDQVPLAEDKENGQKTNHSETI